MAYYGGVVQTIGLSANELLIIAKLERCCEVMKWLK